LTEISIEKYSPKHKESVLDLLSYLFDTLNLEERRKRFEWKFETNPYTKIPLCYIALDNEMVIGHTGYVIQKYQVGGKEYSFSSPSHVVVHPEYRRKGVFSKIIEFSSKDLVINSDINLILAPYPNKASAAAVLKCGYESIGKTDYMYKLSFFNILKSTLKSPNIQTPITIDKNRFKIEITSELRAQDISLLMNKSREENKISNVRDRKFYEWRFSEPFKDYIFAYCTKDDGLVGYVGLNNKNSIIMEYGYLKTSYIEELIRETFDNLSPPYMSVYTFTRSEKERKILSRSGFRDKNDWLIKFLKKINLIEKKGLPVALIKPITKNITEEDFFLNGKDVRDPKNWSLFKSDLQ